MFLVSFKKLKKKSLLIAVQITKVSLIELPHLYLCLVAFFCSILRNTDNFRFCRTGRNRTRSCSCCDQRGINPRTPSSKDHLPPRQLEGRTTGSNISGPVNILQSSQWPLTTQQQNLNHLAYITIRLNSED